jgi:serine protease
MSPYRQIIGFLLLGLLAAASISAPLSEQQMLERARCEVLVKSRSLNGNLDEATLLPMELQERICSAGSALPISKVDFSANELQKIQILRFSDEQSAQEAVEILLQSSEVEWAERRLIRHTCGTVIPKDLERPRHLDGPPNDPFYPLQWSLEQVHAETAWDFAHGDTNIVIAICDIGTDFTHADLAPQRWMNYQELRGQTGVDDDGNGLVDDYYGYDWVDLDGNPAPENGDSHGTHVAGIAGAARNNGLGISGVAGNCRLMGVRCGEGTTVPYGYEGIWYAARAGAKIINCSWSGYGFSNYENEIVQYARGLGSVVVAAAGNDNEPTFHYPAFLEGVVGVAATDIADYAASFTNYGSWVDIAAPGVNILSTLPQNGYGYASGTSMACPLVAGALAVVWSRWPQLSGSQAPARLIGSADPIDLRNGDLAGQLGLGRLNLYRAVADTLPGIRLQRVEWNEIAGDMDGRLEPGERGSLIVPVYNELSPAQDVVGSLEVMTSHMRVVRSTSSYGDLPPGGPYENRSPYFEVELLSDAQNGLVAPLVLEWKDGMGRILARTTYLLQADSQTVTLANGAMALGIGENGCLGFYDYTQDFQVGTGLEEFARPSNLLWHGSLLVGAHGAVSDNCFGNTNATRFDFAALPDSFAWVGPSSRADLEAHANFRDSGASSPLFIDVKANVLAFFEAQADHLFIVEFQVKNVSLNVYDDVYIGLFLDWDIPLYSLDSGDFDTVGDLAYVRGSLPGFLWGGAASITQPFSAFRLLDNESDLYGGGWTDSRKWDILSGGIVHPPGDTVADVSEIVSFGPLQLKPDSTTTVAMALLVGEDLETLRQLAETARSLYLPMVPEPPANRPQASFETEIRVFPNPATSGTPIRFLIPERESARVFIYNILGQQVGPAISLPAGADNRQAMLTFPTDASGIFFYRITTSTHSYSGRLFLLK